MRADVRERTGAGTPLRGVVVGTLVVGSVLLGVALHTRRGTQAFYAWSALLAAVWLVGALTAGGVPRPVLSRHSIIAGAVVGASAWVVFVVGDLIFREVPWLHHQITSVVGRADVGSRLLVVAIAVVNGAAEEAFFRGSVFTALSARAPVLRTTAVYLVVTACAGNVMLIIASVLMGALWAVQRRVTHGVVASAVTHVVWSVLIITALPR